MLSQADHDRVNDAILQAEASTQGEIFCVVAHESSPYREAPFAWAALIALVVPPLALTVAPVERLVGAAGEQWNAAQAGAVDLTPLLLSYAVLQAVLFAATLLIAGLAPVRRFLTPGSVKQGRVHARALEQFAHRLHATEAQTGVLIYASLAERRVEVIADEEIHQRAGEAAWAQVVAAAVPGIKHGDTAGGLIAAVKVCGDVLTRHCPATGPRAVPPGGDLVEI